MLAKALLLSSVLIAGAAPLPAEATQACQLLVSMVESEGEPYPFEEMFPPRLRPCDDCVPQQVTRLSGQSGTVRVSRKWVAKVAPADIRLLEVGAVPDPLIPGRTNYMARVTLQGIGARDIENLRKLFSRDLALIQIIEPFGEVTQLDQQGAALYIAFTRVESEMRKFVDDVNRQCAVPVKWVAPL